MKETNKQRSTRRKTLRNRATLAEKLLWNKIKNNKSGFKFRRQQGIDRYIVDFCCPSLWIVIEVDGDYHFDPDQKEYDKTREEHLKEMGYIILRFWNNEVEKNIEKVLKTIYEVIEKRKTEPLLPSFLRRGCRRRGG